MVRTPKQLSYYVKNPEKYTEERSSE